MIPADLIGSKFMCKIFSLNTCIYVQLKFLPVYAVNLIMIHMYISSHV